MLAWTCSYSESYSWLHFRFSLLLATVTWPGWMPVTVIFLSGLIRVTPLTTLGGLGMRTDMRLGRSTLSMAAATLLRRNISWNSQVFSILIIFIPRFWSLTRWGWSTKDKSRIFAEVNMICFAIRFRDLMIWHSIVCDFQWFNKWMKLQRHLNKFQTSKLTIKDCMYTNQMHSYICYFTNFYQCLLSRKSGRVNNIFGDKCLLK